MCIDRKLGCLGEEIQDPCRFPVGQIRSLRGRRRDQIHKCGIAGCALPFGLCASAFARFPLLIAFKLSGCNGAR